MKRDHRNEEIERLEREVENLRHLARPDRPSGELDRLRTEVSQVRHKFHEHLGA